VSVLFVNLFVASVIYLTQKQSLQSYFVASGIYLTQKQSLQSYFVASGIYLTQCEAFKTVCLLQKQNHHLNNNSWHWNISIP